MMCSLSGKIVFLALLLCADGIIDFPQLKHIKPSASPKTQEQAASDVIQRLIGAHSSQVEVLVDPTFGPEGKDTYQVTSTGDGVVHVTGTSGVAVAMGFYHYLKQYCNGQRTWAGQQTELPPTLPPVLTPIKVTTNDRFRYYQNVCTLSYTMAFWDWERWEQEIDWMALHGINLPLAFIGQEAIFQRVYMSMGFTQADMDEHFGGPAFLAWARMGNIQGWGGPLPQMWITNKLLLQHKILQRMRSLGMIPVLPGFAGHVPSAITRVFPKANVTHSAEWGHFNSTYSGTYLLDFQDPLFTKIGSLFIQAMQDEFGTDHIYNCDTFNEMTPSSSDPGYITQAGKAVFSGMLAADKEAVWLMQGWLFGNSYWKPELVKALVTSVPQGRMIILDLFSENNPIYQREQSYYGQPFIWCMLHNFGGTMELYGAVDRINTGPFAGRSFTNSTMIGIGLTPEGIHQNEVIYEFMMENTWRTKPRNVTEWVMDYAHQRYGEVNQDVNTAWQLLMIWYNPEDLFSAWDGFINASGLLGASPLFRYDLTDVTRNSLQVIALTYYSSMITAYKKNDTATVKAAGKNITDLLTDMDELLASNERFLLGKWTSDARAWATDGNETKLMEYNARNQITLWGPNGEIHDYASKQWSGVVKDFYVPRWKFFTQWLVELIQNGTEWDNYIFVEKLMPTVETPWTLGTYSYPTIPTGNPVLIARALHTKYRPVSRSPFFSSLWKAKQQLPPSQDHSLYYSKLAASSGDTRRGVTADDYSVHKFVVKS